MPTDNVVLVWSTTTPYQCNTGATYSFRVSLLAKSLMLRVVLIYILDARQRRGHRSSTSGAIFYITLTIEVQWLNNCVANKSLLWRNSILTHKRSNLTTVSKFQSIGNWGRAPMYPDYIPDDDSIVIAVFYQVCPSKPALVACFSLSQICWKFWLR